MRGSVLINEALVCIILAQSTLWLPCSLPAGFDHDHGDCGHLSEIRECNQFGNLNLAMIRLIRPLGRLVTLHVRPQIPQLLKCKWACYYRQGTCLGTALRCMRLLFWYASSKPSLKTAALVTQSDSSMDLIDISLRVAFLAQPRTPCQPCHVSGGMHVYSVYMSHQNFHGQN